MKGRYLSLLSLLLLTGCTHLQKAGPVAVFNKKEFLENFWTAQELKRDETTSIEGKLRLEVSGPKRSLSGQGRFLLVPEGGRVELRDPLGRLQYLLRFKAEKFTAYYPSQKIAYTDEQKGRRYLQEFLKMDLDFFEVRDLWLGLLPKEWKSAEVVSLELPSKRARRFKLSIGRKTATVDINEESWGLERALWEDRANTQEFIYEDFASCCGALDSADQVSLARSVLSKNRGTRAEVEVEWLDLHKKTSAHSVETFELSLPKDVENVLLK